MVKAMQELSDARVAESRRLKKAAIKAAPSDQCKNTGSLGGVNLKSLMKKPVVLKATFEPPESDEDEEEDEQDEEELMNYSSGVRLYGFLIFHASPNALLFGAIPNLTYCLFVETAKVSS